MEVPERAEYWETLAVAEEDSKRAIKWNAAGELAVDLVSEVFRQVGSVVQSER